ncbi:MAG: gamma-glutamyltransferase, partial [Chloroflexota bacterium]|nr:gamma-glutamyltransferase [Chloroflexota bacterium]
MSDLRTRLTIEKSEARGRRGMVATKHEAASAVGVDVLAAGGSAVDAAVAAALAVGVVEPWSSGIGGGGYAVVAGPSLAEVVAFPMRSGSGATPDRYPRDGRRNVSAFLWDGVVD